MDLIDRITQFINTNRLIVPDNIVIVGLSGGPDSTFLLRVLTHTYKNKNTKLIAAHLDHGWRSESHQDVVFCAHLCRELNVPFVVAHADQLDIAPRKTGSLEDYGRQLRRHFFCAMAQRYGAHAIAVAHHADDQIETFFIKLARGTTARGLICMQPRDGLYIRPLLTCFKKEILEYLNVHQITYLNDPTNVDQRFLRNRIRHTVIPALEQTDQRLRPHILQAIESLAETQKFVATAVAQSSESSILKTHGSPMLDLKIFGVQQLFMQQQTIIRWLKLSQASCTLSHALVEEIRRYLLQSNARTHLINDWLIVKKAQLATITKAKTN